jgi:zinc protease
VRTDDILRVVERLFGEIPAGPPVARLPVTPVTAAPRRLLLEDRVELPRLYLMFTSPELFAQDDAVLDVTADLVANGRTSRLYRKLMHDTQRAAGLGAGQGSREMGSLFQVVATAAPDVTSKNCERTLPLNHRLRGADRGRTGQAGSAVSSSAISRFWRQGRLAQRLQRHWPPTSNDLDRYQTTSDVRCRHT